MNIKTLLTTSALLMVTIVTFAADESTDLPGTWFCYADGADYQSTISREAVVSSPAWSPGAQLPLSLDRTLAVARTELAKLVKKPEEWDHSSITLARLRGTKPEHWYFVVSFEQEFRPEQLSASFRPGMVQILVDFSGQPGTVKPKERE